MSAHLILEAAARALARHGYHGMSMRELARELGRSPASFYNHFDSKQELLYSVQRRAFESLLGSAVRALADVAEPEARLYVFVLNHVRTFAAEPDVMRVLIHEASALPPARRAPIRALKQRYFEIAREIVAELADLDPAELERTTYGLFGMLNWIYGWFEPGKHGAPDDVARTIHRIFVAGVGGRALDEAEVETLTRGFERLVQRPLLEPGGES